MRRVLAILVALVVFASCAESAAAEAAPAFPPLPPRQLMTQVGAPVPPARRFHSGFTVDAAGGYKVGVETFGGAVMLVVFRGDREDFFFSRISETGYLARGVATPERLQATFGKFGKVSMRFRESRHRTWRGKRRDCRGRRQFVERRGVFVGNLRFRGEDGYVSVRIHRAKGTVVTTAKKCLHQRGRSGSARASSLFGSALFAETRDGVDSTTLLALEIRDKTVFLATHEESRGKLAILRFGFTYARKPIHNNEAVTSARLSPPAPFHGTGRYRAAPDGTVTWSGDLSIDFPGTPRFPLTGPEFKAFLEVPF